LAGQHGEQPVQRVPGDERLVAQGHDEQRAERLDAARGVAEYVDGGVVGPVGVLDQQHRGPHAPELLHQRREDAVGGPLGQRVRQRPVRAGRGVVQRAQRARGHEVVAR
jgi:hypothetical protein